MKLGFCFIFAILTAIGFGFVGFGIGALLDLFISGKALNVEIGKYAGLVGLAVGAFYFGPRYYKHNYPNLNGR